MSNTKEVQILGEKFTLTIPFVAGMTIDENAARVLNQTRCENIANNFRKDVKEAIAAGDLTKVREAIAEYDAKYEFNATREPRTPVDPVEAEAYKIARQQIKELLAAEGKKLKEIDPEKLEAAVEQYANSEEVIKLAKTRVNQMKKTAGASLSALGLV